MSTELLPCPFCGDKETIGPSLSRGEIECGRCGGEAPVDKWNTRHIPEGYALVPAEPTVKTLDSMDDAFTQNNPGISGGGPWFGLEDGTHESIYKAMISAAQEDGNASS